MMMNNSPKSELDIFLDKFANWVITMIKRYSLPYLLVLFFVFMLPTVLGISSGVHEYYAKLLKRFFKYVNMLIADCNNIPIPSENDEEESRKRTTKMNLIPEIAKKFELVDVCPLVTSAVNAIVDDNVTKRFSCQELKLWNMLKRSMPVYYKETTTLRIIWCLGFFYRYFILLPNRIVMFTMTMIIVLVCGVAFTLLPEFFVNLKVKRFFNVFLCRLSTASMSIKIHVHGKEYMPESGICVANHTTPLDAIILCSLQFFTMIGQSQGGFFGLIQMFFRRSGHIFFERSQMLDRNHVANQISEHAKNSTKPPVILFPEGTCINNTSVMMFRKGSFELAKVTYPVAIKYRSMYGDAFWNSSVDGFLMYLFHVMSSWMIYCDVTFLPPVYRQPTESTIDYAARVRRIIAENANLIELDWDGNLKRNILPAKFKDKVKEKYAKTIIIPTNKAHHQLVNSSSFVVGAGSGGRSCILFDRLFNSSASKNSSSNYDDHCIHKINFYDDTTIGVKKSIHWKSPFLPSPQQ